MPDMKQQPQAAVQLPDNNLEGQMAKADLYRAAKMSIKLFQMIQDNQDLEEWIQAKITKSADYLDSIYHYLEYQMKFGSGTSAVASVDDITADLDTLTPANDERSEEDDEEDLEQMEESMNYEQQLKALLESALSKKKSVKEAKADEPAAPDADAIAKRKAREAAQRRREEKAEADADDLSKDVKAKSSGSSARKITGKSYGGGQQKDDDLDESADEYSTKKARAGKDIGKPGKQFAKIAKKAEKAGAKSGEAVAGAVLKKLRAKEGVEEGKKAKPDFLDVDKDGNKKETFKKAVKDKSSASKATDAFQGMFGGGAKDLTKNLKVKEAVKESADLDVILKLAGRRPLNG